MAEAGYKSLISYQLANIAFQLGWDKADPRLTKLRQLFEGYPIPSNPSPPLLPLLSRN